MQKSYILSLFWLTALALTAMASLAHAKTLELVFWPPEIEMQNICSLDERDEKPDDLSREEGDSKLTNAQRLAFLQRDIRRLQIEKPDQLFDFIITLIDWRATLSEDIRPVDTQIDKIRLYIDAGRLDSLKSEGLIEKIRAQNPVFTSRQRLTIAQYYLNGIGVEPDAEYARGLIRDAAFSGNAEALLQLARMELEGNPVPGWDAPLDITITLAFGGMLGQMNSSVCKRARRIAMMYTNGDIVSPNAEIAYAWNKFAADLGGSEAAWRIVEFHLNADAAHKDNEEMRKYLRLAVQNGFVLGQNQVDQLKATGDIKETTLYGILGYNLSLDTGRNRPAISPFFQLSAHLDGEKIDKDSPYIEYLQEVTKFETAPGWVFTRLAKEILVRRGRWAAEKEALELLEIAAKRRDPEGMQLLALRLMRYRDDPAQMHRAINLLTQTVSRFGMTSSMNHLDKLYRCQANNAPMLHQANLWATNYAATQTKTVQISATDLIVLDPFREPLVLAQLQSQALDGRVQSLANFLERLQLNPWASERAKRMWAARIDGSHKALELFARLEFELATNPAERHLAVELFRRVYLNNGVTTALDLAITLTEDEGRNPVIAKEIITLLTQAANRGEGASIRLMSRLLSGSREPSSVYEEYKDIIEERGDFLALLFAMPYISAAKFDDYIDRAVSLMSCSTKDSDEIGDAYAIHLDSESSYHWRRIGLSFKGGHSLSKLRLINLQMDAYSDGKPLDAQDVYARELSEGNGAAQQNLYRLAADPDLPTYNPQAAAGHMLDILARSAPGDEIWVLAQYRKAGSGVRSIVSRKIDIEQIYINAARRGDVVAKLEYGLLLRRAATTPADLQKSTRWLSAAAESGNVHAMAEFGYALALGIGVEPNAQTALIWLDQAANKGNNDAKNLAHLLRLERGL